VDLDYLLLEGSYGDECHPYPTPVVSTRNLPLELRWIAKHAVHRVDKDNHTCPDDGPTNPADNACN
jgi:hypothetical protein